LKATVLELRATVRDAELGFSRLLEREAAGDIPSTVSRRLDLHTAMARLSRVIVTIFEPEWRARTNPLLVTTPFSKEEKEKDEEEELIAQANIFVANRVVDFLHNVFPQLANLVGFAMAAVLALMMAISVYPFPRHDSLLWFSWIVLLTVIGISITVFAQMNRDRIISMLSGTQPGRLNFDSGFIGSLLLYAVIPILALLGAQFPGALGGIFSWIGGLFRGQR
jgi:hypothetical protein